MQDKDDLKQNKGAQQGNIHQDSDEGTNETGKAGSTLEKTSDRNKEITEDVDKVKKSSGNTQTTN